MTRKTKGEVCSYETFKINPDASGANRFVVRPHLLIFAPSLVCIMSSRNQAEHFPKILATVETGSFVSIHDLSIEFRLSASYLQHLFKARTGSRLGRRLAELRLRRAAFLLVQSNSSIKEIAYAVGYRHPSSFIRAFERFFERSPSDYRQEMLTEKRFG